MRGLVEFGCGWWAAVAAVAPDQIRLVLHFDPVGKISDGEEEIFVLRVTVAEAGELVEALQEATRRAAT